MYCLELLAKYIKINFIIGLIILSVFGFLLLIPRFRGEIRNAIYQDIIEIGIPVLEAHLDAISIPDQTGNTSTPFGTLFYGVTNITLKQVKLEGSYISITSGGAIFTFCNATIKGHADWYIKLGNSSYIQTNGSIDIDFLGIKMRAGLNLMTYPNNGTLVLHYTECEFKIEKVKLMFQGTTKLLLNMIRSEISEILKDVINHKTCGQIKKSITKSANEKLKDIPLGTGIGDAVKIFIALFKDSKVGASSIPEQCRIFHRHSNIPFHGGAHCSSLQNATLTPATGCGDGQQETTSCVNKFKAPPQLHF